ncbi:hypothetical protein EPUS_01077 [Endocarpon pusillum Z07020]|uniref:DUF2423 domain-containing protein n=1 Tax=Endocarpon pusillum (strain Z07020 / HMAS-L-300199) TaxID=1263415 RepID=U1GBS3_ENDPU|nr:uncharacterized protein EPUS_01077 [Endocarpon pusillum Z07020]ERF69121.1 hypothetical protein EPUS_01077 [Endocarpon pusillum Z07020]
MAKGARASTRKRNNAALRAKIFGPAVDARTERLSAKLQELVSRSKPSVERMMEVDSTGEDVKEQRSTGDTNIGDDAQKTALKKKHSHHGSQIEKKKAHRKARNSIVFPSISRKGKGPGMLKAKR